jgi:G:T-mismatch repair DNA endonuclease (very short patch repair protein)
MPKGVYKRTKPAWNKGNKDCFSEQVRQHLSDVAKGKIITPATRLKMSLANRGEKHYFFGKRMSDAQRQKTSESRKGKGVGRLAWNAGLTKETDSRVAKTAKARRDCNTPAWNKGLTKETDPRVAKVANKTRNTVLKLIAEGQWHRFYKYRDTKPELKVRGALKQRGVSFTTYKRFAFNKTHTEPDLFIAPNIYIYVDGCWYHACPKHHPDSTWADKEKDKLQTIKLRQANQIVIRLWECEINGDIDNCIERVLATVGS